MDLTADGVFMVVVDNFKRVNSTGGSVEDLVDYATASATDSVEPFEL